MSTAANIAEDRELVSLAASLANSAQQLMHAHFLYDRLLESDARGKRQKMQRAADMRDTLFKIATYKRYIRADIKKVAAHVEKKAAEAAGAAVAENYARHIDAVFSTKRQPDTAPQKINFATAPHKIGFLGPAD